MRRSASGAPMAALWQLAGLGAAFGLVEVALVLAGDPAAVVPGLAFPVVAWIYLGAGIAAWARRPGSRVGVLLTTRPS